MALRPFEWRFNGVVWGADNPIGYVASSGWSPADIRIYSTTKAEDHGSFITARYLDEKHIMIQGDIQEEMGTTVEYYLDQLRTAFNPVKSPLPLSRMLPGWTSERFVLAYPSRLSWDEDLQFGLGYIKWAAEFVAQDPRIYDSILNTVQTPPLGASTFGIDFPIDFPINFGGGQFGLISLENDGTFPTPLFVRIDGPATNPQLINNTTGEVFKLQTSIIAGDYVSIDFLSKSIMLNGVADRYYTLTDDSVWWGLSPGISQVTFLADASTGTTLATIQWRNAWR
jgi:hypothetical protein